jgi:hypothetical protein
MADRNQLSSENSLELDGLRGGCDLPRACSLYWRVMERVVLVARLRDGAHQRARELAASPLPNDPAAEGFRRVAVFVSEKEIVFMFEADGAESIVRRILTDPVQSTAISPWLPLFDGPLHRTEEAYYWRCGGSSEE